MESLIENKKLFIKKILQSFSFKQRASVWILNYVFSYDDVLGRIHFVDSVENCPNGIIMSTLQTKGEALLMKRDGIKITDGEKIFHTIRLNKEEEFYIQIIFPKTLKLEVYNLYLQIVENNKFDPVLTKIKEDDLKEIDSLLEHCKNSFYIKQLATKIDKALDERNEALFNELTVDYLKYKKLQKNLN